MTETTQSITVSATVTIADRTTACEYLAARSGLPKSRIKDAMQKGAVWLQRGRAPRKRLRRATTPLHPGDRIALYYDARLLQTQPPRARLLQDLRHYSVWYKPPGLMAQGNNYGDHCSLLRQVEQHFTPRRAALLVHRLDREAHGLMLVAHSPRAAAALSRLFQARRIVKRYQVSVRGLLAQPGASGVIEQPLDGKPALTRYQVLAHDIDKRTSTLQVELASGRKHQIRRHCAALGHPVMGDPRYGRGNKNRAGLQLTASYLAFQCPLTHRQQVFELPADYLAGQTTG